MICLVLDAAEAVFPVRFLVQALVLFRENLAQWAPVRKDGSPNEHSTFSKLRSPMLTHIPPSVIPRIR